MMQGDSYGLTIDILRSNGTVVTSSEVSDVEITIGSLRKTYSGGGVIYDSGTAKWVFKLTQEETFKFPAIRMKSQVRVVWPDGSVEGIVLEDVNVIESLSKEVL